MVSSVCARCCWWCGCAPATRIYWRRQSKSFRLARRRLVSRQRARLGFRMEYVGLSLAGWVGTRIDVSQLMEVCTQWTTTHKSPNQIHFARCILIFGRLRIVDIAWIYLFRQQNIALAARYIILIVRPKYTHTFAISSQFAFGRHGGEGDGDG